MEVRNSFIIMGSSACPQCATRTGHILRGCRRTQDDHGDCNSAQTYFQTAFRTYYSVSVVQIMFFEASSKHTLG